MNMTRDRVQSIVWAIVLAVSAALLLALTFRVNAVRSEVRLAERRIIAIKQEKLSLETEFQTRANQQQLAAINAVEFGFKAPGAGQYVEGERQLAALSRPLPPAIAPALTPGAARGPVLMARADRPAAGSLPAVLAPLAGKSLASGPGTHFLSDRNEAPAKAAAFTRPAASTKPAAPTKPAGSIRLATAAKPDTATTPAKPAKRSVPARTERLAMGDAPTRTSTKASKP